MVVTNTIDRAFKALNLEQYNYYNFPDIHPLVYRPKCPLESQYILRMLVKQPFNDFQIPEELEWLRTFIDRTAHLQKQKNINQPYCYVTVRHGKVQSVNDDVWHVDGFSMNITHLPEQNYIWSSNHGTEFMAFRIDFPKDFNPLKHNIHYYIQSKVDKAKVKVHLLANDNEIYCVDPYVIHKRPDNIPTDTIRTFVRIDYSPIMIFDDSNTQNPLIPLSKFNRDGVKDFRDKLVKYS